jgi:hypothetical protein
MTIESLSVLIQLLTGVIPLLYILAFASFESQLVSTAPKISFKKYISLVLESSYRQSRLSVDIYTAFSFFLGLMAFLLLPLTPIIDTKNQLFSFQIDPFGGGYTIFLLLVLFGLSFSVVVLLENGEKNSLSKVFDATKAAISLFTMLILVSATLLLALQSLNMQELAINQNTVLSNKGFEFLLIPGWGIFIQPIGSFLLFLICIYFSFLVDNMDSIPLESQGKRLAFLRSVNSKMYNNLLQGLFVSLCLGGYVIPYLQTNTVVDELFRLLPEGLAIVLSLIAFLIVFSVKFFIVKMTILFITKTVPIPKSSNLSGILARVLWPLVVVNMIGTLTVLYFLV